MAVTGGGFADSDNPVIGLQTETISGIFFQFNRVQFKTDPMGVIVPVYLADTIANGITPAAGTAVKFM